MRSLKSGRPTPRRLLALAGVAIAATIALGGCSALAAPRVPRPCGAVYSDARCLAMTDLAASQLATTREAVVGVEIMPEPTPEVVDGKTILVVRSGGPIIELRVTLADGSVHKATVPCVGVTSIPACLEPPRLQTRSPSHDGYRDTPEGASPVPPPAAEALADARELRIARLDIPIDHAGPFQVRLGEALLPNGIMTNADFELVDEWPAGVSILDGLVRLEVRSLADGKPLLNIFEHGWREGTERVEAILVFDVFRADPGAVLSIRDLVVG